MSTPHKATAEQWAQIEKFAADYGYDSCLLELRARVELLEATQHAHAGLSHLSDAEREAAMNELRAASAELRPADDQSVCPHIITSDEGTSYCGLAEQVAAMESAAPPASSLVERPATFDEDENDRRFERAKAIIDQLTPIPSSSLVERVDRAAIREVAAWLRDRGGYPWEWVAQMLEQESDR